MAGILTSPQWLATGDPGTEFGSTFAPKVEEKKRLGTGFPIKPGMTPHLLANS